MTTGTLGTYQAIELDAALHARCQEALATFASAALTMYVFAIPRAMRLLEREAPQNGTLRGTNRFFPDYIIGQAIKFAESADYLPAHKQAWKVLLNRGYITQGPSDSRGSASYSLTPKGRAAADVANG